MKNNLNQNINEEYRYNIYQLVVSPFHYLPANYFYPDKIIVSAKSTDDSFLNKILFYRLKDKYNRLSYKILNSLFPQINIISRLNIILPFQYGPSSFLALAVAANINKSYPQKSSALLKTATIYATGSYEYIINPKNKADEIKLLDYYSKNNFKITEIGKLKEKIASILKHVQDYQIESFLIILSKENKNTVTQFTNEIKEEVDYLKIQESKLIKNYQNSLITTKKNIILNFIFEKYFIAHQKQYSQLITKNKKAQEELSTLKNILLKHILYIDNYENVEDLFTHKKCTNMFYQKYKYNVKPKTFPYLTELSFTGDHPLTDYLQNVFDCKNENEIELDTCLNYFKNFNSLF